MTKRNFVGALLAALLVVGFASPEGADTQIELTATSDGWTVTGLTVEAGPDESAEVALSDGVAQIALRGGEVIHLYDSKGRPVGKLAGLSDYGLVGGEGSFTEVHAPVYVVDRDNNTLIVAWRQVPGADSYIVTVNGKPVDKQHTGSQILLKLSELAEGDLISIDATSSVADRGNEILGTMSVVVSEFMLDQIDGGEYAPAALPATTSVRFTTFIPEQYVGAPLLICQGGGLNRYFGGDNRSWSATSAAYRTRANLTMNWNNDTNFWTRAVGNTTLYSKSGSTYTLLETRNAGSAGIQWTFPSTVVPPWVQRHFLLGHAVTDPFCSSIASLDYNVVGFVNRTEGYTGFNIYGSHDRAPNYEFYYSNSSGVGWTAFRLWNHGAYFCLTACTQASFNVLK